MMAEMTTKSEKIYLVYPPFVHSLHRYLRRQQDRNGNWNRNQDWNQWSKKNTKRKTIYTATDNHPSNRKRSSRRCRGRGGSLLQEGGR